MLGFYSIPIGAVAILLLHLIRVPRRVLFGVFFATLAFAFFANIAEWGSGPYYICQIFKIDNFTRFFSEIFIFVMFLSALSLFPKIENDPSTSLRTSPEIFSALFLLAVFAMMLTSASTATISLFLSLEFLAISFYELVAFKKDKLGMEAAIKFFVVGVFASLLFLLGAAFFYGETGGVAFAALQNAKPTAFLVISLILMLAGIGFKMSLFPFNLWLPDVYEGSPGDITAVLAGAAKKAGFAAYLRIFVPILAPFLLVDAASMARPYLLEGGITIQAVVLRYFGAYPLTWQLVIALLALFTMTFGNVAAVLQKNVKRLIAYSIIAHAGFIMIGLASANQLGYQGAMLHIVIHALMATGVFVMIGMMEQEGRHTLGDYNGAAKGRPFFGFVFAILLASLTGIPPLAGFFSKFLLFSSAVDAGMLWLAVAGILNSVVSSYFYFSLLRRMFGYEPERTIAHERVKVPQFLSYAIPVALLIVFGLAPNALLELVRSVL